MRRLLVFLTALSVPLTAHASTVLVLQFHNSSPQNDLNWVGESVAERLRLEFSAGNQIVLSRESQTEALRRLSLRPDADFTKASLIKLGQSLGVNYVCYGSYDFKLPEGSNSIRDSSIQISARFLDLSKMRDGTEVTETGKVADLSRLEEHLAWQSLKYIDPALNLPLQQFLNPQKFIRLDAEESYIRGLLSPRGEQQQKWLTQAAAIDPHFAGPAFELGKVALEGKEYRKSLTWFGRIPATDPRYVEARFRMGLGAYGAGDFIAAANYFREVAATYPLNEVFNNLGAAEGQTSAPAALQDLRRALEADGADPTYQFNLGLALMNNGSFEEAEKLLRRAADRNSDDREMANLLDRARRREAPVAGSRTLVPFRLKPNFDQNAFRQLKRMLQSKVSN
ncbi:MAG: tetratricopeptide repeat protein [Bryobacteraceae bacterium]